MKGEQEVFYSLFRATTLLCQVEGIWRYSKHLGALEKS
jgi:hypothetical protein